MVDRFRLGRLVVIQGAGHLIPMERPEALAAVVAAI
jgi:pimeloyl-ACP methyl ester carboxylesterase